MAPTSTPNGKRVAGWEQLASAYAPAEKAWYRQVPIWVSIFALGTSTASVSIAYFLTTKNETVRQKKDLAEFAYRIGVAMDNGRFTTADNEVAYAEVLIAELGSDVPPGVLLPIGEYIAVSMRDLERGEQYIIRELQAAEKQKTNGRKSYNEARAHKTLARVYFAHGDTERCREQYKKALIDSAPAVDASINNQIDAFTIVQWMESELMTGRPSEADRLEQRARKYFSENNHESGLRVIDGVKHKNSSRTGSLTPQSPFVAFQINIR